MALLNKVMKYLTMFQSKNAPESQNFASDASHDRTQGAKVAAIAAALHHHDLENSDVRAKVAAIAAALHHHETQNSQNGGMLGIAALVAAIHHRNNIKK
ncbi:MAG: hypothetical protein Q8M43_13375 [Sulfuricurvum sp.]|uniref:hypothetical protein n=1 Tax=Sulfuricurvum sp. TaxID=2025608 RepID=UPI0027178FC8|nr:hypothetical protein [Sulfuricurvum sp.]MDO9057322.1 hypothetical protein [Sulfuricurvum sp.]MDP2850354.1 hypothetical protein [Sulfuricurvum sp.]MDP3293011.1 hypothetical protein [Sulfuricurvum sp.]